MCKVPTVKATAGLLVAPAAAYLRASMCACIRDKDLYTNTPPPINVYSV